MISDRTILFGKIYALCCLSHLICQLDVGKLQSATKSVPLQWYDNSCNSCQNWCDLINAKLEYKYIVDEVLVKKKSEIVVKVLQALVWSGKIKISWHSALLC